MAWRFKYNRVNKNILPFAPSASTGGCIHTSDIGKLCTMSSNKVGLLQASSLSPTIPVVGIFQGFSGGTTGTSAGSTLAIYVAPIAGGEILELDISTAWSQSAISFVLSSNIGMYMKLCTTEGIAAGGSSIIDPGVLAGYLNCSTAVNAADTSKWIRLMGCSSDRKSADVQIPTSNLML